MNIDSKLDPEDEAEKVAAIGQQLQHFKGNSKYNKGFIERIQAFFLAAVAEQNSNNSVEYQSSRTGGNQGRESFSSVPDIIQDLKDKEGLLFKDIQFYLGNRGVEKLIAAYEAGAHDPYDRGPGRIDMATNQYANPEHVESLLADNLQLVNHEILINDSDGYATPFISSLFHYRKFYEACRRNPNDLELKQKRETFLSILQYLATDDVLTALDFFQVDSGGNTVLHRLCWYCVVTGSPELIAIAQQVIQYALGGSKYTERDLEVLFSTKNSHEETIFDNLSYHGRGSLIDSESRSSLQWLCCGPLRRIVEHSGQSSYQADDTYGLLFFACSKKIMFDMSTYGIIEDPVRIATSGHSYSRDFVNDIKSKADQDNNVLKCPVTSMAFDYDRDVKSNELAGKISGVLNNLETFYDNLEEKLDDEEELTETERKELNERFFVAVWVVIFSANRQILVPSLPTSQEDFYKKIISVLSQYHENISTLSQDHMMKNIIMTLLDYLETIDYTYKKGFGYLEEEEEKNHREEEEKQIVEKKKEKNVNLNDLSTDSVITGDRKSTSGKKAWLLFLILLSITVASGVGIYFMLTALFAMKPVVAAVLTSCVALLIIIILSRVLLLPSVKSALIPYITQSQDTFSALPVNIESYRQKPHSYVNEAKSEPSQAHDSHKSSNDSTPISHN